MTSLDPMRGCVNQRYFIECPDGTFVIPPGENFPAVVKDGEKIAPKSGKDKIWRWTKERYLRDKSLLIIKKVKSSNLVDQDGKPAKWNVYSKTYLNDVIEKGTAKPNSLVEQHINQLSSHELHDLDITFPHAKPSSLIKFLCEISQVKNDDIILDSFAGSGTTAHAVLDLNAENGGNRKFILIECEDYADKLTAERVRRVIKGVTSANDERLKKGLGGSFSFYELGDPIDIDAILDGKKLPTFESLAHYAFYTATGETFYPNKMDEKEFYVGSSSTYEVFMLYAPDADKLREIALNLDFAEKIEKKFPKKPKLVFAPACYLEEYDLRDRNIRFAQLPFEIYRLAE